LRQANNRGNSYPSRPPIRSVICYPLTWNNSLVYATTAADYATRLAGAPPLQPVGGNVPPFSGQQTRVLQALLVRRGFEVGGIDGKRGAARRAAVKAMQLKLCMPADPHPTPELLEWLRTVR
jgi:peptidoglycan hydrolase-like protein with peptidoglycan-binding domain